MRKGRVEGRDHVVLKMGIQGGVNISEKWFPACYESCLNCITLRWSSQVKEQKGEEGESGEETDNLPRGRASVG